MCLLIEFFFESNYPPLEKTVHNVAGKFNLAELLRECSNQLVTSQYKLLSVWILDYAQTLRESKLMSKAECGEASESGEAFAAASRRSGSPTEDGGVQKEKRKNLLAEKRRAKILAQLSRQQKSFIQNNKTFFDEAKGSGVSVETAATSSMETGSLLESQIRVVCIGPEQTVTSIGEIQKKSYQCILCQEEEEISVFRKSKPMVRTWRIDSLGHGGKGL